jgi:hypothetical protein
MIYDVVVFALDNAYFQLGHHILKQILGLPMGNYVAYGEHHATIPRSPSFLLVMLRYMDDVLALAGIYPRIPHPFKTCKRSSPKNSTSTTSLQKLSYSNKPPNTHSSMSTS